MTSTAPDEREPASWTEESHTHPSWGMIRVNRVSSNGTHLFDSEIAHQRYITVELHGTTIRERTLHRDWLHPNLHDHVVEVSMSEAQWGAFVSSFGDGAGVPCTIVRREGAEVDQAPHESRLGKTAQEVKDKAATAVKPIQEHLAALQALVDTNAGKKAVREALFNLTAVVRNLAPNLKFAADSLTEHTETVVTKARADIEAMVLGYAQQHGVALNPSNVTLELEAGDDQ